jgi:hypothetical protein
LITQLQQSANFVTLRQGSEKMTSEEQELIGTLKTFERVNKRVIQLSRQLSELRIEVRETKRKIAALTS